MSRAEGQLQLWRLRIGDCSDADLRRGLCWLGEDELGDFRACESPLRRRQFALGRLLLRGALSHLHGERPPSEWRIVAGPHGRPELAPESTKDEPFIGFNLAHSGDLIVLVTGPPPALGIDLEDGRKPRHVEKLARRWFNPAEIAELAGLPSEDRLDWFYRCWTIKEAWSKARGGALAPSLRQITLTRGGADGAGEVAVSDAEAGSPLGPLNPRGSSRWRFVLPEVWPGFHCALVCQSGADIHLASLRMIGLGQFESIPSVSVRELRSVAPNHLASLRAEIKGRAQ